MQSSDQLPDDGTLVVYLTGYRELHSPETTLGVRGPLATLCSVADKYKYPLAPPPDDGPPDPQRDTAQLLRLDRLSQFLAEEKLGPAAEFLFVLTDQSSRPEAAGFADDDTIHLRPLLARWCEERGHVYTDVVVNQPPHQLDTAGVALVEQLDQHLGSAREVVLVAGGGPAALQIAGHFASFRGVRSRDALTVLQLEEVRNGRPGPGARAPVDTKVQRVREFHGVVGRRSIEVQAIELLDNLDLPGAAQLVRATRGTGLLTDPALKEADTLLGDLARDHVVEAEEQLAAALDLAEVEWSRPGGSRLEAVWYAGLAVIDLLPRSWGENPPEHAITDEQVRAFRREIERGGGRQDGFDRLIMSSEYLRGRALPLVLAGPAEVRMPDGIAHVHRVLEAPDEPGGDPAVLLWYALRIAFKDLRDEHAHKLVGLDQTSVREEVKRMSAMFQGALRVMAPGLLEAWEADPAGTEAGLRRLEERVDDIERAMTSCEPWGLLDEARATRARRNRRNALEALADGDPQPLRDLRSDQVSGLVTNFAFNHRWFAVLSPGCGAAAQDQKLALKPITEEIRRVRRDELRLPCSLRVAAGHEPLGLDVNTTRPASRLRAVVGELVGTLAPSNALLVQGHKLRSILCGDEGAIQPSTGGLDTS